MSALYILAGLNHFRVPWLYLRIMPSYIPYHKPLIYLSGLLEIALGIGLLFPLSRDVSAWGIILLLVLVFPANIEMVRNKRARLKLPLWLVWARLPLQLLLIFWAWLYT
jgi:uncharacterized membrane protein